MRGDIQNAEQFLTEARENLTCVNVHAITLTASLEPYYTLVGMDCPYNKEGKCSDCEHFYGVYTNNEPVYAYKTFEAFCAHPK